MRPVRRRTTTGLSVVTLGFGIVLAVPGAAGSWSAGGKALDVERRSSTPKEAEDADAPRIADAQTTRRASRCSICGANGFLERSGFSTTNVTAVATAVAAANATNE